MLAPSPPRAAMTLALLTVIGCSAADSEEPSKADTASSCTTASTAAGDFLRRIACRSDFDQLASEPLDTSIPGARSVKVVVDGLGGNAVYFQNSKKYKVHYDFVSAQLSGNGHPVVPSLTRFNETEYYSEARRFVLGSITYYEGQDSWLFEIAPYDTADDKMVTRAFDAISKAVYFAELLHFHPTSTQVERVIPLLPERIKVKTTEALFEKVQFQPLNLATAYGQLRFVAADQLSTGTYLSFRDIVVLDNVPNDLSVTMGIITQQFQTPLSHINVLAQNRRTPNMALRDAFTNPQLRALTGQWVKYTVTATGWSVTAAPRAEADAWWQANRPRGAVIAPMDTTVTDLRDVKEVIDRKLPLKEALQRAIPAFGGKATHFAALAQAELVPMPTPSGFVIPVHHYWRHITANGFDKKVDALLMDTAFRDDPGTRDRALEKLRDQIEAAPMDAALEESIRRKLTAEYPNTPMRFRSSSSAEDLAAFPGAGLYTSKTGDLNDPTKSPARAIKKVWASVWFFRGFEERDYRSVDQKAVGMAVLAHPSYPNEQSSGVALTANPFDPSGLQPGFFINVQPGDESVTLPRAGVTADQFIYHHQFPGQPQVFHSNSSLVAKGTSVLTRTQVTELGKALVKIHEFFRPAYGPPPQDPKAWYALEVDFKFDGPPGQATLSIKQARPHPGRQAAK